MSLPVHDLLRVLLVEDSPADVDILCRELRPLHPCVETLAVDNAERLRQALEAFAPHLVLSDFSMPGFNGLEALKLVRELAPDTPFIFVSGTIGEEVAITALHAGADDYVLKDNLRRLASSVERALRNAAERQARRQAERALRASEERFRALVETTEDWIWEAGLDGTLTYSNIGLRRVLGYMPEEVIGRRVYELMDEGEDARVAGVLTPEDVATRRAWRGRVVRWRHRDGSLRILESNAQPILDENGNLLGFRGIDRDVTQRVQQEARIRTLGRMHAVLAALGDAVLRADTRARLVEAACRIAVEQGGFSSAWIAGRRDDGSLALLGHYGTASALAENGLPLLVAADEHAGDERLIAQVLAGRSLIIPDLRHSGLSAGKRAAAASIGVRAIVGLPLGEPAWGALVLYKQEPHEFDADEMDLLKRVAASIDFGLDFIAKSERLEFLAYHNPLTVLPNRAAFRELLQARMDAGPQLVGMVAVVRFDVFRHSRGREFGDALLRALAARLGQRFDKDALLAHPGEDTFLFALPASAAPDDDLARIQALIAACSDEPFLIEGEEVFLTLRCGLLRTPEHAGDAETAERNVAAAYGEAAEHGVPLLAYDDEIRKRAERRIELERELRHAIDAEQFELFLQPKFEARSQRVTGAEALLRWRHPQLGLVSPAEFIPLLEDTGLIVPVGHWVLRCAARLVRQWRKAAVGGLRIAVNVSARELRQHGFVRQCASILEGCGGEPCLDIEITESVLMEDIAHSMRILQALRDLGFGVAIDDFGTGYSSLNYLSRLPADTLKIDQSFVAQIAQSPESLALVTNTINLAHALGLRAVAEGVEEEEQAKLLRLLRCDELQGYLLGRPLPVDEFERTFLA